MTELSGKQEIDIVNSYFAAYQSGQYDRITPFLHPTFTFSDPSFPTPTPQRSRALFSLFCATMVKSELRLEPTPAEPAPDGNGFVVRYTCDYIFGAEKRKVHNDVVARVTLCGGMVGRHVDVFDVGVWGKQALGWWGVGLGACGVLEGVVRWWAGGWLERWCEGEEGAGREEVDQDGVEGERERGERDIVEGGQWVFVK
ncbi:uncharacterized protein LAJ45_03475 [Morchella importuna]|uniref:uncharacterized protein n=1 Tax=Morchella importuna TaxID=1174673 RepID=UPI001E8CD964|nr:uncharacterized protein LAJ45_03475 [Morchella importuna]KAH8152634.1 hypothetical protein LAJ45_03475 [Morchella importuna]